jgi:two-component system OmpR family sensor kinase
MGRLFWKFFFILMLAQATTIVAVSSAIWLRHRGAALEAPAPAPPPPVSHEERERPSPPAERHAGERPRPGGPGRAPPLRFPIEPIIGGMLASLAVAALLAWYVSKPIRFLRGAFDAAARGDLDARIGSGLGTRRDELADLGHHFDRTAAQIKGLMQGQRRLLHDVSHELRSPLARLRAAVGLARQHPDNVDGAMDRIDREAERMDKLVDEILMLSRVESGVSARHDETVEIAALVRDVVEDAAFEAHARSKAITLDADIAALETTSVKGNAEMLHRALENIVRNAMRHVPDGGKITVAGTRDHVAGTLAITVADNGPGVAQSELASIFEPFFRGSGAKDVQGHGLGLAIARRVIEAHGGRVAAANRPQGGLVVTLQLPA